MIGKACVLIALAFASSVASAATAPDLTVFGMKLGEPLALPECAFEKSYGSKMRYVFPDYKNPPPDCWKHRFLASPGSPQNPNGKYDLQLQSMPRGFSSIGVELTLIDGRVESLWFPTVGTMQADVKNTLVAKYGSPTTDKTETLSNRMGASFESLTATWTFDDLQIVFLGLASTIEKGVVTISTQRAVQKEAQRAAEQRASERKM